VEKWLFIAESSALFEMGNGENWQLEAVMKLMCNCLSFDFDFGSSFMCQDAEIGSWMRILWKGFST